MTPFEGRSAAGILSAYNDEHAHIQYVNFLLENKSLPGHVESISADGALERGLFEYYQSPAYYIVSAGTCLALNIRDRGGIARICRLLSLAFSLLLIPMIIALGREFEWNLLQYAAGMVFWALNGVLVRFSVIASNDSMFWLALGGLFLCLFRMSKSNIPNRDFSVCCLLFVAAIYIKLTAVIFLPLLFWVAWRRWSAFAFPISALAYLGIIALTFPIWYRNYAVFQSLLPLSAGFGPPNLHWPGYSEIAFAIRSFYFPWQEFWNGEIGLAILFPLALLNACTLFANLKNVAETSYQVPGIAGGLAIAAFIGLNMYYAQSEARYIFAAWPSLILLLTPRRNTKYVFHLLLVASLLPYTLFLIPV